MNGSDQTSLFTWACSHMNPPIYYVYQITSKNMTFWEKCGHHLGDLTIKRIENKKKKYSDIFLIITNFISAVEKC